MCDLFKTRKDLIEYYFGSDDAYVAWKKDIFDTLDKAGVSFYTGAVNVALFPEKREEKTKGGLYKPETSEYRDGFNLRAGQELYLVGDTDARYQVHTPILILRPYGNIDLGHDIWRVPDQNLLFNIKK